jgi:hypothetical protein
MGARDQHGNIRICEITVLDCGEVCDGGAVVDWVHRDQCSLSSVVQTLVKLTKSIRKTGKYFFVLFCTYLPLL